MFQMSNSPTRIFAPFGGAVEVRLFGRIVPGSKVIQDSSIALVKSQAATEGMPGKDAKRAFERLWEKCRPAGVKEVLAPSPVLFNSKIVTKSDLTEKIAYKTFAPGEYDKQGGRV